MKKIYTLLFAASALFAATSCQEEIVDPTLEDSSVKEAMTITATVGAETKTVLGNNGVSTFWTNKDQISVFDSNKERNNRKFSVVTENVEFPAKQATFALDPAEEFVWPQNDQPDPLIVALYPYQENAYCDFFYYDRNYITGLNIPVEQKGVKGAFDPTATFALATGKYSTKDELQFTNLYSLLRITLKEEGVTAVKVTVEGGKIAGKAKIQLNLAEGPVFDGGTLAATDEGSNSVTLVCEEGFEPNEKYYIAVAPVTYTNIKVDILKGETWTNVKNTESSKQLEANHIYNISNLDDPKTVADGVYLNEEGVYEISNKAGLFWLAEQVNGGKTFEGEAVSLVSDIDLNNENWTPIGFNSNDEAGNEPYFSGTFDGNEHSINNLKIDLKDKGGVGLFGAVYNATFKNFTLNNVDIKAVESEDDPVNSSGAEGKKDYIVGGHLGAVVGYDAKAGTLNFENVHLTGLIKIEGETRAAQGQRIGGIIGGRSSSTVNFKDVTVMGGAGSYIKGYCSTAGVSGQIQGVATYENVKTDIDVHAITFGAGGIAGIARHGSTFTDCSSAGDIILDASKTQLSSYSANYPYRVGGIAGCWSEAGKTGVLTVTGCSYTGTLTSMDKDGKSPEVFDYAGYVGRGYTLNGCQGSTVIIGGVSYVQAFNEAANSGIYYVNDKLTINTAANFKAFGAKVNGGETFAGKNVVLGANIDLKNEEWTPIGTETRNFEGNFDGGNKVVQNLKITTHASITDAYGTWAYAGLFGVTSGAENQHNSIKNIIIENVEINSDGDIVAAAVAYPYYTDIENITVRGDINIKGANYTSGVIAYTRRCVNAKDLTIEGNKGSKIEGAQTIGGVISDIQMNGGLIANYSNFKASGLTITGTKSVGGISGIISEQTLDGATVENVTIVCEDVRRGTVSGSLGGVSTIKNISVTNVAGADKVVGATYDSGEEVVGDENGVYTKRDWIERNLAFAQESGTATCGEDFKLPELTGEGDLTKAVYSVAEGEAATVTEAGVVTLVKAGTVTIKATVAADETHLAGEATYTLTVNFKVAPYSLIGTHNGWSFSALTPMYEKDGYYFAENVEFTGGECKFKFIAKDATSWSSENFGSGATTSVGNAYRCWSGGGDNVLTAGRYDIYFSVNKQFWFIVNANDEIKNGTIKLASDEYGFVGNIKDNNWSTAVPLYVNGRYLAAKSIAFAASPAEFKIRQHNNWSGESLGTNATSNHTLGTSVSLNGSNNVKFTISTSKKYDVYTDLKTIKLVESGTIVE